MQLLSASSSRRHCDSKNSRTVFVISLAHATGTSESFLVFRATKRRVHRNVVRVKLNWALFESCLAFSGRGIMHRARVANCLVPPSRLPR